MSKIVMICEHCEQVLSERRKEIEAHESVCAYNPNTRGCGTCRLFDSAAWECCSEDRPRKPLPIDLDDDDRVYCNYHESIV
jgi:hypothetical protein